MTICRLCHRAVCGHANALYTGIVPPRPSYRHTPDNSRRDLTDSYGSAGAGSFHTQNHIALRENDHG